MPYQPRQRTPQQNRAMHLLFRFIADELNEAGLDMKKVLKPEIDIPWTERTVKEFIWRPLQKIVYGLKSTTELKTTQIDPILDIITKHFGEKFGIEIEFPSVKILIEKLNKIKK